MAILINGYRWVPSVYLMQGLPFALVTAVSPIIYKAYGLNNSDIALYTSLFALPWTLKFFFAPLLETLATKRQLTLCMQCAIASLILLLASILPFPQHLYLTGILFTLIAMSAMLHDISADGLYLDCLDPPSQAKFIGIRTIFYQVGKVFCQGGMVYVAGLFISSSPPSVIWSWTCMGLSVMVFCITCYNYRVIPLHDNAPKKAPKTSIFATYRNVLHALRQLPHIVGAIIFVLLYHFPEWQLVKILPLYMLDQPASGGLGLSVTEVGIIYGGVSMVSMLMGVTLAGFFLNRIPLRKCLLPFTVLNAIGNISYLLLQIYSSHTLWQISFCIFITQFLFGLSNGAYMFYLIALFAKTHYIMSLYAIGTAFMLLGMTLSGSLAGFAQTLLGYTGFFVWVTMGGIGVIFLTWYNVKNIL